jgi:hypothetical protein
VRLGKPCWQAAGFSSPEARPRSAKPPSGLACANRAGLFAPERRQGVRLSPVGEAPEDPLRPKRRSGPSLSFSANGVNPKRADPKRGCD